MAELFEPDELNWSRAPVLSASLIDFIQTDSGARFLDLDYSTIFKPEFTNLTNPAGARNQYMALSHDDFAAVRVAYETQNPNIIAHVENALEVIGELYPDFKLDADDVIAQMQYNNTAINPTDAPEVEVDADAANYLTIDNPSLAEELYNRYDQLFNDDQEYLAAHAYQMADGYAIEGANLDHFRQMLVHDNFKLIRDALALKNEDTNELIVDVIDTVNDAYPGFRAQMRAQSDEINQFYVLFEAGVLTPDYLALDKFVSNNIAAIDGGELDPVDYIGNLSDYIEQGVYTKQFIQQAFSHDNFKFTDFLRALDNDDLNNALDSLFNELWENNSPEFSTNNDISTDDVLDISPAADPPKEMNVPEMPPVSQDDEALANQDEITADPPPPPPPPGAAALNGLRTPNISTAPNLRLNEALALTRAIQERMENLPEDNDALQAELSDISNDLKEIAIALNPNVAGDPRLLSLPPASSNPNNFEEGLSQLKDGVNAAVNQVSHAELTELLIQNSQQAGIVARSIDYIAPPEIAEENAPADAMDGSDTDVDLSIEAGRDDEPDMVLDAEAAIVSAPTIDYSTINRPNNIDPNDASTYGISSDAVADPTDVVTDIAPEGEIDSTDIDADADRTDNSDLDAGIEHESGAPEASAAKITLYLETDMSVESVQEILSGESFSQFNSEVWMSNTSGDINRLWIGQPNGDMPMDTARELAQALVGEGLAPRIMVDGQIIDEEFAAAIEEVAPDNSVSANPELANIRPVPRPADLFADNASSAGIAPEQSVIRPQPRPERDVVVEENAQTSPAQEGTRTRLSELLDGRGYHNDTDQYTDYDAMQDAFKRSEELGITTEHIEAIRVTLNSPNFILQTSAAIEALNAYNETIESGNEANALSAFFNTLAPEDFVQDLEDSIDDRSVFDKSERNSTHDRTVQIENNILPKL